METRIELTLEESKSSQHYEVAFLMGEEHEVLLFSADNMRPISKIVAAFGDLGILELIEVTLVMPDSPLSGRAKYFDVKEELRIFGNLILPSELGLLTP